LNNLINKLNNNIENTTKALDRLEFTLWKNQGDTPTPKVEETPVIEDNTFETTPIIQSNPLENKLGFFNGILEGLQKRAEEQKLLFTPKKFESSDTGGELYLQSQRNQSSDMKKMYLEILGEISSLENSSNNLSNNSFQEIRINLLKNKLENTRKSIDNLELSLKDNKNETPTPQSTEKSSIQNSSIHFEEDTQVKEENSETTPTMQPSLLREEFNSFNEILGGLLHQAEEQQLNFNPENFNNSSLKGDFYTSTQQQQFFTLQNNYNNYLEDIYSFDNRMNYFLNDNINYQNMNELKSKLEKIKNALDLLKDTLQVEKETPTPTPTSLPSVETTQEEEIENVKRNTLKIEMEKIKSELEIVQNLASFQKENFSPSKFGPVYIDYQNQFIDALRERLDMPEKQLNMILENVEENSVDQNEIQSSKEKLIKIQESLNEFSFFINKSKTQKNTSEDFNSTQNELSNNENSTPLPEKTTLLTEEETKETSKHLKRVKLESIISDLERLNAKIRNQENMFQTGKFGDVYIDYQIKMLEEFKNQSHVLSETLNELKEEDLSELSKEIEYINLNFRINQLSLNILNDKSKT
jgi:small nuclear ribonucleoprotein (snRNP)-like protein